MICKALCQTQRPKSQICATKTRSNRFGSWRINASTSPNECAFPKTKCGLYRTEGEPHLVSSVRFTELFAIALFSGSRCDFCLTNSQCSASALLT